MKKNVVMWSVCSIICCLLTAYTPTQPTEESRGEKITWDFENISYGSDREQNIDLVCPEKAAHAIVYIHGGGYILGNKSQYPSFLTDYAGEHVVASVGYRLIDVTNEISVEDILSDLNNGILKIIEISNENGADIKDIILIGHSAGAHLGLLYAYTCAPENGKIQIAACVSLSGATDFTDDSGWTSMAAWGKDMPSRLSFLSWFFTRITGHTMEFKQRNWTRQDDYSDFEKYLLDISPVMYVTKTANIPPTLLVHTKDDDQVPYTNALKLKSLLDFCSVPNTLITPTGSDNDHLLGGKGLTFNEPLSLFYIHNQLRHAREWVNQNGEPIWFSDQSWLKEAKEWLDIYLK